MRRSPPFRQRKHECVFSLQLTTPPLTHYTHALASGLVMNLLALFFNTALGLFSQAHRELACYGSHVRFIVGNWVLFWLLVFMAGGETTNRENRENKVVRGQAS